MVRASFNTSLCPCQAGGTEGRACRRAQLLLAEVERASSSHEELTMKHLRSVMSLLYMWKFRWLHRFGGKTAIKLGAITANFALRWC